MQLSPSGKQLAFVTVSGEERMLVLLDLATKAQTGGVSVGQAKVRNLDWIGETKILITTTKTENLPEIGLFNTELPTAQIYDPGKKKLIPILTNSQGQVLNKRGGLFQGLFSTPNIVQTPEGPALLVRAFNFDTPDRLDMYRVDIETGRARLAEVMGNDVDDYLLDPSGKSIAKGEYDRVGKIWKLQLSGDSGFRETHRMDAPIETPQLMGLGLQGNSVIVYADRPDMTPADKEDAKFYDVNLQTGVWRPVRFEFRPTSLLFHPVTRRLIGATEISDTGPVYAFVDPAARTLWENVQRSFAGKAPRLVSWSDDFKQGVVFTNTVQDSGSYFIMDLAAGKLTAAGSAYAGISNAQVAPVQYINYAAADGLEIHGFLTTPPGVKDPKNLPLVVLPHGGPAAHDGIGFDWWSQAIASRGYAVLQPNFRGSTGYGDAFEHAGYGEWGRKMQTDLSDGVRHLTAQSIVDPKKVCIVGGSYGGYAALAGPTLDKGVYRCAVAVAGVSDLRRMVEKEANIYGRRENQSVRYWNRFMGADRLGDRSLDDRSPAKLAAQADAPIMLIHGRDDSVVDVEQSRMMADALKKAGKPYEYIELNGEDHWLSRTETRQRMLTETIRFLQAHNPPG
ncbi:MAG: S9 family peptidase [Alphaproteobacteria bacterium]|nr:MAG: S9 family peptidase [Alphaproteobacteria bacterium]